MFNKREISKEESPANKFWSYVKKNGFSILMLIFIGVMFVSPDAKSFVLRQFMRTGLFNASIDDEGTDKINHTHVDFDFSDEKGNVRNTSSLRGKVVFINFWASWCPPCRAEFPSIKTLYSRFKDNPDIFFLTINEDENPIKGKAYLEKEKFSVPFYKTNGNVPDEIYTGALPTTVVLDKAGNIRFHHTGFANYASDSFVKQIDELVNFSLP